jgi:hypothetical protein
VVIVKQTGVVPAPAAIEGGLNIQLLLMRVGSGGEKLQSSVTFPGNVEAPLGAALKLYASVVCPAFTV